MKARLQILALATLLVAAASCGKKSPTAAGSDNASLAVATNEASQPLEGPVNDFLTGQLRIFIQDKGHLPKDFAELAQARLDSIPRTPPGMKWAIDPVTQDVKLVKQ